MKKIFAILMAMIMMLSMVAMAQTVPSGNGGSATITVDNAAKGVKYAVYKIFDATVTGEENGSIAYKGTIPAGLKDYFVADKSGNISVAEGKSNTEVTDALSAWVKTDEAAAYVAVAETECDGTKMVFTGLQYGYYVVTTTQGSGAVTVTSTNPDATIQDKNSSNPIINENAKTVGDVEYKIGDTANFTVTFTATNFTADNKVVEYFTVKDTPTGMEINVDSLQVMVGTQDITASVKADTKTDIEKTGMDLNIAWATKTEADGNVSYTSLYNSPSTVTITYSAVVTSVSRTASNKAEISYNGGTPVESTVEVTTHQFALVKTDEDEIVLTGAKFELYDEETEGTKISLVKESDGVYRVATPAEAAADGFASAVIEAGNVIVKGLDKDVTYYLEETEAPNGYNKLTARVAVDMTKVADAAVETTKTADGEDAYVKGGVQVENASGSALPSTGGIGTTIFYVVGGLLMAAAVVLLVTNKKMSVSK